MKKKDKKKIIKIILIVIGLALLGLLIYGIYWYVQDFLNDYRCSTMSISDFYQDPTCRKYWGLR